MMLNKLLSVIRNNKEILIIGIILSLLSHSIIIYKLATSGVLYTGKGDGIAQMLPFQLYLYDKFSHFSMHYAVDFGIGGDYVKSLSYYFSTSLITYLNFALVWLGDLILPYDTTSIDFWAKNQVFVSIIKLYFILVFTYKFLRYIKVSKLSSYVGAYLYGFSTVYYFFTFTWCFFSDVMLWLVMTIYGIERIYKEKKVGLFIVGIALTVHSNFYFSYYEFIFVLLYFLFRLRYANSSDVMNWVSKIKYTVISSIIGAMIGSVGLYLGMTSFLGNDRKLPDIHLKPIIDLAPFYNIFYDGYYISLISVVILSVLAFKLYSNYYYRLFATFTIFFMVGSLSPLFDSFFNGFSIDQRRWVYLLAFVSSVLVALFLDKIKELSYKDITVNVVIMTLIMLISIYGNGVILKWVYCIPIIIILIYIYKYFTNNKYFKFIRLGLAIAIMVTNFIMIDDYEKKMLTGLHPEDERSLEFLNSSKYNSKIQRELVDEIKRKYSKDDNINTPYNRIDWMTSGTHNTPMYQHFNGLKLYSSIFDKDIYQFYDKDLNVTMDTDSNSIYYRLGDRANLYSVFKADTIIRVGDGVTIPYGYKKVKEVNEDIYHDKNDKPTKYVVYENENKLPYVRVTDKVFSDKYLKTPIDREHAMLYGVVLDTSKHGDVAKVGAKPVNNLITSTRQFTRGSTFKDGILDVKEKDGGITMILDDKEVKKYHDLYVELSIELKSPNNYHYVMLNEIYQSRKPLDNDYRRFNDTVTFKVKANKEIKLKLQPGQYTYKLNAIYGENYSILEMMTSEAKKQKHHLKINNRNMEIKLGKHNGGYVVLPFPYLEGMRAKVDGKDAIIQEGNYLMTAVKVDKGAKEVIITYTQPYLWVFKILSILGLLLLGLILFKDNKYINENKIKLFKKVKLKLKK